jgi:L-fuconate dehydratase
MNPAPDNSIAYVVLETADGIPGYGLTYSTGRGNEVVLAAVEALRGHVVRRSLTSIIDDMAGFWRSLTSDGQLRWLGPEKGVVHLATAAIVNAVWDLLARIRGKPLWQLLVDMSAEELVACIDFRYIDDVLSPADAVTMLDARKAMKGARLDFLRTSGYPAYTTSAGWLGFTDERVRELLREAVAAGWTNFKVKVGAGLERDRERLALIREEIGWDRRLMLDANQIWSVDDAIKQTLELAEFAPWWIEEPTSPDDVLGHARIASAIAPILVATGEHCHNRVMLKQFLQAGGMNVCQADACRLGGVSEMLAAFLLAAHFGVPCSPHCGGVGIGELMQHLSVWDHVALGGDLSSRPLEWVDHSHEIFADPARLEANMLRVPSLPGTSLELRPDALAEYEFPNGPAWA